MPRENPDSKRAVLEEALRQEFEATLPQRIDRYLDADHYPITGNTPFAAASAEVVDLHRDGHFYGCISLAQAVGEALLRHLCSCNGWRPKKDYETNLRQLKKRHFVESEFEAAAHALWEQRNDFHHLNPSVPSERQELTQLAATKMKALAAMESWAFEYDLATQQPLRPQYWPKDADGKLQGYLRFSPAGSRLTRRCS